MNHEVPTSSDGFVFSITAAKSSTIKYGDKTVESCKMNVKLVNNTQFNLKKILTSFKSVDDLGQKYGKMRDALFSTVEKGEIKIKSGLDLRGECTDLRSGVWKVLGDQNPYSLTVHKKGISRDDLLDLVKYFNSGIFKFTNASD